jgi:hypothetical protein
MRKNRKINFRFIPFFITKASEELAKFILHMYAGKFKVFSNHLSAFIMCNWGIRRSYFSFHLRCRCSRERVEADVLDLPDSSTLIHLEADVLQHLTQEVDRPKA